MALHSSSFCSNLPFISPVPELGSYSSIRCPVREPRDLRSRPFALALLPHSSAVNDGNSAASRKWSSQVARPSPVSASRRNSPWLHRLPESRPAPFTERSIYAAPCSAAADGDGSSTAVVEKEGHAGTDRNEGSLGEADPVKPDVKKRIVSGVQPTGSIHLGNYLGAIKNWVPLQDQCDTLYFVVDLHAITLPHDPVELAKATRKSAAVYIACGVDPAKASIFVQSHVKAHSELTWLLSCITPISWLNKMIQFKEKSRKAGEDVGTGLLTYPLLMASDILLYQCDMVPVGEDQRQHLELTRDVAARVNSLYGGKKWKKRGGRGGRILKVPELMIPPAGARVMSLVDGTSKMSKSAPSDLSRINLLDSPEEIANKIKRCKTDAFVGMEFDNPERPECTNLLSIYQLVSGQSKEAVAAEVADMNWGGFKPLLADALVAHLAPLQKKYEEVVADPAYVDSILADGAARANEIADATLADVYDALGFMPPARKS